MFLALLAEISNGQVDQRLSRMTALYEQAEAPLAQRPPSSQSGHLSDWT
jgi:hypothetical protein